MIVHGGWGGGWEWTAVARVLRKKGHDVFTPTLTGMGERAHLGGPGVGLATHVEDVVAVLELEDLHDVVLCGHSYGGMPVSGAADLAVERIALIIYIDALMVKVRDGNQVRNKAAHLVVGVDVDGVKHVLGIWVQNTEGAKFS